MGSGPNIPAEQRRRPMLRTTTARDVLDGLIKHCERTGETMATVIERALRKELGLLVGGEERER